MVMCVLMKKWMSILWINVSHMWWNFVLYYKKSTTNNNDFKSCIAKPKLFCFFNFISWLVYYPFVCALFVINWIKWKCSGFLCFICWCSMI